MHQQLKVFAAAHRTTLQEMTLQAYIAILNDTWGRTSVQPAKKKRK
ncbi:MAG: hypothetical protein ACOYBP_08860 [Microbacteriaceae bacterium]